MAEPWYVEAFRAEYLEVYAHRDLESARREADYLVRHGVAGRALDLCCGSGRHCLALRERGVEAFGLDYSADLLSRARGLEGKLVRADARAIPISDGRLDAVVSLFSSFGYFGDDGDRRVLAEAARVLRRDGVLALDLMNPQQVRDELVPRSHTSRDGIAIEERRQLADGGRRVVKDVRWKRRDGSERSWREDVRLYEPDEIGDLLERAGFARTAVHGDFDAAPFAEGSPRQIVLARKR